MVEWGLFFLFVIKMNEKENQIKLKVKFREGGEKKIKKNSADRQVIHRDSMKETWFNFPFAIFEIHQCKHSSPEFHGSSSSKMAKF